MLGVRGLVGLRWDGMRAYFCMGCVLFVVFSCEFDVGVVYFLCRVDILRLVKVIMSLTSFEI